MIKFNNLCCLSNYVNKEAKNNNNKNNRLIKKHTYSILLFIKNITIFGIRYMNKFIENIDNVNMFLNFD